MSHLSLVCGRKDHNVDTQCFPHRTGQSSDPCTTKRHNSAPVYWPNAPLNHFCQIPKVSPTFWRSPTLGFFLQLFSIFVQNHLKKRIKPELDICFIIWNQLLSWWSFITSKYKKLIERLTYQGPNHQQLCIRFPCLSSYTSSSSWNHRQPMRVWVNDMYCQIPQLSRTNNITFP